jgi:hypothetical protein
MKSTSLRSKELLYQSSLKIFIVFVEKSKALIGMPGVTEAAVVVNLFNVVLVEHFGPISDKK